MKPQPEESNNSHSSQASLQLPPPMRGKDFVNAMQQVA
jgi:hypothetical protein